MLLRHAENPSLLLNDLENAESAAWDLRRLHTTQKMIEFHVTGMTISAVKMSEFRRCIAKMHQRVPFVNA